MQGQGHLQKMCPEDLVPQKGSPLTQPSIVAYAFPAPLLFLQILYLLSATRSLTESWPPANTPLPLPGLRVGSDEAETLAFLPACVLAWDP